MKSQITLEIKNNAKIRLKEIIEFLSERWTAVTTTKTESRVATIVRRPTVEGKLSALTTSAISAVLAKV
jgi:hypothetical protein